MANRDFVGSEEHDNFLGLGRACFGFVAQHFLLCLQPVICWIALHSATFLIQLICALADFRFDFRIALIRSDWGSGPSVGISLLRFVMPKCALS